MKTIQKTFDVFSGKDEVMELNSKWNVGDRVKHRNAGQHAGSGRTITNSHGTVTDIHYAGFGFMGHTFVAKVQWDDGQSYSMNECLLQSIDEETSPLNPETVCLWK